MGKYSASERLAKAEIDELFMDFAKAIASLRNSLEWAKFIKDLFSESEVVMLARRLQVARLLSEGCSYDEIHRLMRVGNSTIARVHTWMDLYGEGYKTVINRTKSGNKDRGVFYEPSSWAAHKKKYPMYYWPELLLKEIVRSANAREKKRLLEVLGKLREKTRLAKELSKLLQPPAISHTPAYGRKQGGGAVEGKRYKENSSYDIMKK